VLPTSSNNVQFLAPLIYVSATQINYMMPDQAAVGTVNIMVTSGDGTVSTGSTQVANTAPGLFTYGATGQGIALGSTTFDGITYVPLANQDGSPALIDPGTPWKRNILVLRGTGVRYGANVSVRIGNVTIPAVYAGQDGSGVPGFDQINVPLVGTNLPVGQTTLSVISDGQTSNIVQITFFGATSGSPSLLSLSDVQTIIAQCVQRARQVGLAGTCAVTDREGNPLAVFQMNGANTLTRITGGVPMDQGLEGQMVPAMFAAVSKAGTSSFFSTQGSAISTRTASAIIGPNFPRGVPRQEGGPLFGVQFSSLPCSDVRAATASLPLGLSGDPGSASLYKGNIAVGGVGFEGNGLYTVDLDTSNINDSVEEDIGFSATFGFQAPANLRIDTIRINGVLVPYVLYPQNGGPAPPVTAADGQFLLGPRAAPPSRYIPIVVGGVPAKFDPNFFPVRASTVPGPNQLTASDVLNILTRGLQGAIQMRAAIRNPGPTPVQVNVSVVDTNGAILGILSNIDAPEFGFDVCVQKARTANLFSSPNAQALLTTAGNMDITPLAMVGPNILGHVNAALAFGFPLNGSIMFSSRGMGFAARPFFPDGQNGTANGPFSRPFNVFSEFNNGLQLQLVLNDLVQALGGNPSIPCTAVPITPNGLQIFAGSQVLFKGGMRVGAIGVSGDGIDQDDLVGGSGAVGFEAPGNMNSTNLVIQGVRFPYVRYPPFPCITTPCTLPGQ
jgi:uncharacterized protein (TIGR03437 family)